MSGSLKLNMSGSKHKCAERWVMRKKEEYVSNKRCDGFLGSNILVRKAKQEVRKFEREPKLNVCISSYQTTTRLTRT